MVTEKQQKSNDERTRYLMTSGFTKVGSGALINEPFNSGGEKLS